MTASTFPPPGMSLSGILMFILFLYQLQLLTFFPLHQRAAALWRFHAVPAVPEGDAGGQGEGGQHHLG